MPPVLSKQREPCPRRPTEPSSGARTGTILRRHGPDTIPVCFDRFLRTPTCVIANFNRNTIFRCEGCGNAIEARFIEAHLAECPGIRMYHRQIDSFHVYWQSELDHVRNNSTDSTIPSGKELMRLPAPEVLTHQLDNALPIPSTPPPLDANAPEVPTLDPNDQPMADEASPPRKKRAA